MAKGKAKRARDPMMARSDIPLAARVQLAQRARVRAERQEAAETVMKLCCVALNELYGLGFERLTKVALKTMELTEWYYGEEPEIADAQLNGRLGQMGFTTDPKDGRVYCYLDGDGKPCKERPKEDGT